MNGNELAISVEEAARRLGLSRNLAYAMAQRGELPTVRAGRRRIVPLQALEAWLAERAADREIVA